VTRDPGLIPGKAKWMSLFWGTEGFRMLGKALSFSMGTASKLSSMTKQSH
jgi:hypothetical protein